MFKFILKRVFLIVPLLFGVSIFVFFILRLNGTDAVLSYLTVSGIVPTDETINEARVHLGLDKPILMQYILWLKDALMLDFGTSYLTNRNVMGDMIYYLPATLKLAGFALFITLVVSIPVGIICSIYKDSFFDYIIRFFCFLGVCTPNFWLGLLLVVFFSIKLGILPPFGIGGISHLIMPAFSIAFMSMAINIRFIRSNMLNIKNERFVYYAKLRGVKMRKIQTNHIFLNALIPVVTAIGMHIGELVGGALIVENIFAYPGVGRYAVSAISNNDYPVVQCFVLMMSFVFIVINLIIDIVYALIDPRIRLGLESSK